MMERKKGLAANCEYEGNIKITSETSGERAGLLIMGIARPGKMAVENSVGRAHPKIL